MKGGNRLRPPNTMMKLGRAAHMNLHSSMYMLDSNGITRGMPPILNFLAENDGCIQRKIVDFFHFNPASVSSVLGTMESRGYIERKVRDGDKRAQCVYLTDLGRQKRAQVQEIHNTLESIALDGFTQEEREQFTSYIERIITNFKDNNVIPPEEPEKKRKER